MLSNIEAHQFEVFTEKSSHTKRKTKQTKTMKTFLLKLGFPFIH